MANRRLPMRKIKEVLRLRFECNISEREIARSCQISRTTVTDYLRRAAISGLNWAEASALGEVQLADPPRVRNPDAVRLHPVNPDVTVALALNHHVLGHHNGCCQNQEYRHRIYSTGAC